MHVITFQQKFLADFIRLNRAWIEKYFVMEAPDLEQLEKANEKIISEGGEIFFVQKVGKIIGTCAMLPHTEKEYELIKMAIDPNSQGKGVSNLLMQAVIDWAKMKKAESILILSNRKLVPAISLYKKFGATELENQGTEYQRSNIVMRIKLQSEAQP